MGVAMSGCCYEWVLLWVGVAMSGFMYSIYKLVYRLLPANARVSYDRLYYLKGYQLILDVDELKKKLPSVPEGQR